jgi:hypothetical protein
MGCLESTNFVVTINGSQSSFFRASRCSRQGFPLSPFLFLLVTECLSRLILEARSVGTTRGINIVGTITPSHLLFVDDILLFGRGKLRELTTFKHILYVFCNTTRMEVNLRKSCLLVNGSSNSL